MGATRAKEVAGYTGPDSTAPSMEDMNKEIIEKVVKRTLASIKLKNGETAMTLFSETDTHLYINPSGKFIIGGPQGDAGLTGRKIIIDTYGGRGALVQLSYAIGVAKPLSLFVETYGTEQGALTA